MKKLTVILSSILAAQVLLALVLLMHKDDSGAFHSNQSLLDLTQASFDAISIEQKDKPTLALKKENEQWLLPGYFNAPVDKVKLDDFSSKLLALKTGWPVASTEESAERFQVNKDKFERRIVFQKDGKPVKTLYLGTSPGFKKINARVDGENAIQAIDFSAFEASITPEDWMKRDLLKLDVAELKQIKGKDFSLVKSVKDWALEGLQVNQTSNAAEIKALVDKLLDLSYSGLFGLEDKPEYHLKDPVVTFTLKKQAEEIQYQFGKLEGKDEYALKASNQPFYFKVDKSLVDGLKDITLQKLAIKKPTDGAVATPTQSPARKEPVKPAEK